MMLEQSTNGCSGPCIGVLLHPNLGRSMRAIAGSILILAAVLFHQSPTTSRPFGFCLLWLIVLTGVCLLLLDLTGSRSVRYLGDWLVRLWCWLLNGRNFLVKGTLLGAVVGILGGLVFFGPSQIANVVGIPGAFIGLVLGVALDAIAHRHQYQQRPQTAAADESSQVTSPFADDGHSLHVESHGWDLSLGVSHTVPDWPRDSNPIERR
jgi:hypothetical protein